MQFDEPYRDKTISVNFIITTLWRQIVNHLDDTHEYDDDDDELAVHPSITGTSPTFPHPFPFPSLRTPL